MKKTTGLLIVLITLMTVNVSCQNSDNRQNAGKQDINNLNQKLKGELNLDSEQENKWDDIYKKYRVEFKELRADESLDRDVKKEKAEGLLAELDKNVLSILNDEQQKKYTDLVKRNRTMAKEKYQKRQTGISNQSKGQNKGQNIKSDLDLSVDQSEKWDNINVEYRTKMQSLKNNSDLNDEAKRNDIENLLGEKDAEILAILDSGQQASYLQLVDERRTRAKEHRGKNQ